MRELSSPGTKKVSKSMVVLRRPPVKVRKVPGRTFYQGATNGVFKMSENRIDDVNKKAEAAKPAEQLDLLSVMKDNGDAGVGQMTEFEKQIKEVSDRIASIATRMAMLPPEWQAVMKNNVAQMANSEEPGYEMFLKC